MEEILFHVIQNVPPSVAYIDTLQGLLRRGVNIDFKDSGGRYFCDRLHKHSESLDLFHFAVEQEARYNTQLLEWIRDHPRRPSIFSTDVSYFYSPFQRCGHPHVLNAIAADVDAQKHWGQAFEAGKWPDMTPEEEHVVAHGSYVRRYKNPSKFKGTTSWNRWTPSGEVERGVSNGDDLPNYALERKPMIFPCKYCISRWLNDTKGFHTESHDNSSLQRGDVRFVATNTGGIWDLDKKTKGYSTYAWVPTPSSGWLRYSEDGVKKVIKTVHVPRWSEVSDSAPDSDTRSDIHSDMDTQQDHEDAADRTTKRRARTTSPSSDDDKTFERSRVRAQSPIRQHKTNYSAPENLR